MPGYKITSILPLPYNDCDSLLAALEKKPVAVAVYMEYSSLFLKAGTYSYSGSSTPNHGVVLVGYLSAYGYYVKNSWGRNWGRGGYFWIEKYQNAGVCLYGVDIGTTF